jgi:hypothetical protein
LRNWRLFPDTPVPYPGHSAFAERGTGSVPLDLRACRGAHRLRPPGSPALQRGSPAASPRIFGSAEGGSVSLSLYFWRRLPLSPVASPRRIVSVPLVLRACRGGFGAVPQGDGYGDTGGRNRKYRGTHSAIRGDACRTPGDALCREGPEAIPLGDALRNTEGRTPRTRGTGPEIQGDAHREPVVSAPSPRGTGPADGGIGLSPRCSASAEGGSARPPVFLVLQTGGSEKAPWCR